MRTVTTSAELDRVMIECDEALKTSDDRLREVFDTFEMKPDLKGMPADPSSKEYRDWQMALYEKISKRKYTTSNEASNVDVASAIARPFPYQTNSPATVSDQLLLVALIIKAMALPAGSSILEFGPGWGNTTTALARMGYDVTAVDIESRFLEIIRGRSKGFDDKLTLIHGDFFKIEEIEEKFDAILFKECFHHCEDHVRLISSFSDRLKDNGIIVFAFEPIEEDFPMPWGMRLDGQSLWATRNFGWMELGFNEQYFRTVLREAGWELEKISYDVTKLGKIHIARRTKRQVDVG